MKIVVAGAGLGGLTAGLALPKKGFDVTIVEQARSTTRAASGTRSAARNGTNGSSHTTLTRSICRQRRRHGHA